jgi:hypothetical protein
MVQVARGIFKKCSKSLAFNLHLEIQIKTTVDITSYWVEWLLSKGQKLSVSKVMEEREHLCTIGRSTNGRDIMKVMWMFEMELPYDPAVLLLDIYPKKMK